MNTGAVHNIAYFAEALRGRGMTVTPDQMSDMARSLLLVDATNREHVYAALRCLAITDPLHRVPYDEEFRRFFDNLEAHIPDTDRPDRLATSSASKPIIETIGEEPLAYMKAQEGTSAIENVADRDFSDLNEDDLAKARQLVMAMTWQPSDIDTRRWVSENSGRRPDLRRTLRSAVGPTGDLLQLRMSRRRTRQRPLIIIADISGSMEKYADLFLVFAHAAQRRLRKVEVFTFSTHLTRITENLAQRNTVDALTRVNESVTDWAGGTRIGDALAEWNRVWSRRMARGGPVTLILSDGWDCGDPDLLSMEMGRLARSSHLVMWLNPLAARADYRPATRGMKAILPHIDYLLPAASVNDLKGVVRLLDAMNKRPATARPHRALAVSRN
jgi:uncharacterized protein with von Willebrand factor type A (vWA) domain